MLKKYIWNRNAVGEVGCWYCDVIVNKARDGKEKTLRKIQKDEVADE